MSYVKNRPVMLAASVSELQFVSVNGGRLVDDTFARDLLIRTAVPGWR